MQEAILIALLAISSQLRNISQYDTVNATSYCISNSRMANGEYPHQGAVASNSYPLGTVIAVAGYGTYTVEDRIGHGSSLDILMPSCADAINFGRRNLKIRVIN